MCIRDRSGPEGDITGVTWWSRTMDIPVLKKGQKVFLNFGSIPVSYTHLDVYKRQIRFFVRNPVMKNGGVKGMALLLIRKMDGYL